MKKLVGLTFHNNAKKEDIAKIVLMPGDPLRAKMIAKKYLSNAKLVNEVRGMLAYTGKLKGKRVTVMASGMGMASAGIYSYELFKFYDVNTIIRIGTTGSFDTNLKIGDIILASESVTGSSFAYEMGLEKSYIETASKELNSAILQVAKEKQIYLKEGRIHCTDNFYTISDEAKMRGYKDRKCIASDMESFAIFLNAKVTNKQAACLLTVSDSIIQDNQKSMTTEERETKLLNMIELALGAIN